MCVEVTERFLTFSREVGNDLSTPVPQFNFPGLKPGDQWCLCAARWLQAYEEGAAPKVRLSATHERTLEIVPLDALLDHAKLTPTETQTNCPQGASCDCHYSSLASPASASSAAEVTQRRATPP